MKPVFEVSSHNGHSCVVCNDYKNLELQIVFEGLYTECADLVDRLTEAQARGMFKGSNES